MTSHLFNLSTKKISPSLILTFQRRTDLMGGAGAFPCRSHILGDLFGPPCWCGFTHMPHLEGPPNWTPDQIKSLKELGPDADEPSWLTYSGTSLKEATEWEDAKRALPEWQAWRDRVASQFCKSIGNGDDPGVNVVARQLSRYRALPRRHNNTGHESGLLTAVDGLRSEGEVLAAVKSYTQQAQISHTTLQHTIDNILTSGPADLNAATMALLMRVQAVNSGAVHASEVYMSSEAQKLMKDVKITSWTDRIGEQIDKIIKKLPEVCQSAISGFVCGADFVLEVYNLGQDILQKIFDFLKPIPLLALFNTYDGTTEGLITLISGVLQLYGFLNSATISTVTTVLSDALIGLINLGERFLRRITSSDEDAHLEGPSTVWKVGLTAFIGLLISSFGVLPTGLARTIRGACLNVVCAVTFMKAVTTIWSAVCNHYNKRVVRSLFLKVTSISDSMAKPEVRSSATAMRGHLPDLEKLRESVSKCSADPTYKDYNSTLRSLATVIDTLIQSVQEATLGCSRREHVPLLVVLAGPPGIGKTTLCHAIAREFGCPTPSDFNLLVDHHDMYTGEKVCIWDEFDVDEDSKFIETVIRMVNTSPMHLNCDLLANKRKLFTSKLILATTNSETPLADTHPRAEAFYRRIMFVDVHDTGLQVGSDGVYTGFADDFSHLDFEIRGHLGYNANGDTLKGKVKPTPANYDRLIHHIRTRLERNGHKLPNGQLEGGDDTPRNIILVTPTPGDWYNVLSAKYSPANSFVNVSINQPIGHSPGHNLIIRKDRPANPNGLVIEVGSWTATCKGDDINTLCNPTPKLPRHINQNFERHLFKSAVHLNSGPPMIPIYNTHQVGGITDLMKALRAEYGAESTSFMYRLLKPAWSGDIPRILESLVTHQFPLAPRSFALVTKKGTYIVYSSQGIQVFYDPELALTDVPKAPFSASMSDSPGRTLVRLILKFLAHFVKMMPATLTIFGVTHLMRQRQGRVQSNDTVRRSYAGIALTDDEYDTWRSYNSRDPAATISDFIAAKQALEAGAPTTGGRVSEIAKWLASRRTTAHLEGDEKPLWDEHAPVQPLKNPEGNHIGWASHIGAGIWVTNRHLYREGCTILGDEIVPIKHPLAIHDVIIVKGPLQRSQLPVSSGVPTSFYDRRRVAYPLSYRGRVEDAEISGYTCLLPGGTKRGDCGLPYLNSAGAIVGIHSGRFDGTNQTVISALPSSVRAPVTEWRTIPVKNSGRALGPLPKGTAYGRSPGHPEVYTWETWFPAAYGGGDPRGCPSQEKILAEQLVPFVVPAKPIDPDLIPAMDYVRTYFKQLMAFADPPTIETVPQALERLDLSTSCGPFVPGTKSNYIFRNSDGMLEYDPFSPFGTHLANVLAVAGAGLPMQNAYKLALKDELLPEPKCRVKRRLLWGTDVGVTTVAAMVLGPVMDSLKMLNFVSPVAVGCNVDSTWAAVMVERFRGFNILCLDYSKWDSTMQPSYVNSAVNILCDLAADSPYTESVRKTLTSPANGYFMDKVVTTTRGLPSGIPGTSVLNSIAHCVIYTMAIWKTCDRAGIARSIDPLHENPLVCYGDDCVYGHSHRIAVNLPGFIESLKELGVSPTAADKVSEIGYTNTISFLKREFYAKENMVIGALDRASIIRQALWIKGKNHHNHLEVQKPTESRDVQVQEALIMLSAHPRSVFDKWVPVFQQTIEAENLYGVVVDYESCWNTYKSRYWVGDFSSNEFLSLTSTARTRPVLEGDDKENANTESQMGESQPSNGLITGSHTATQAVLGTAGAPTPDSLPLATLGSGVQSGIPAELYGLWVTGARVGWTTAMPTNTRLASFGLSPNLHPFLRYLAGMYAGWSGSILARILISGSGIYAGRITAVVLPPGISISSVTNPTTYSCAIIDARNTEPIEMTIPDVRVTTYHSSVTPDQTSTFALFVNSPLINPFSGSTTSAAEISILFAPGPDFAFCLLKEPNSIRTTDYSVIFPRSTRLLFSNRTGARIIGLNPVSSHQQAWNHFDSQGRTDGWGDCNMSLQMILKNTGAILNSKFSIVTFEEHGDIVRVAPWNIANTCPDWIYTGNNQPSGTFPIIGNQQFAAAIGTGFNGKFLNKEIDLKEQTPVGFVLGHGDQKGSTAEFLANNILGSGRFYCMSSGWESGEPLSVFTIQGCHSTQAGQTISTFLQTPNTPVALGNGQNQIVSWTSKLYSTWPPSTLIGASQPLHLSRGFMTGDLPPIPDGQMAVFTFSNGNATFEIGVRSDGYCLMGGNSVINVESEEYDITFSTLTSVQTPLSAPGGNGNRGRFLRRR
ncbi:polyprotein [Temminck's stint calicivirus]|nr:polyprotein [Temminck's stint calicivirus]